ncbi:hypothetical protein EV361DRAFT_55952 [Lentinula raphanica]|uniref:U6 snRNA phosphodiesterase 1 n=1 Tax=Lentinula raphanica TaxID=153919 RepID=A0AA38UKX6_9AGAR|nr:hypothetical protein F5880DRAFT_518780 [Lentinula raphanica]KAJ3845145.1 hypothetical protein F5878DRAFT_648518 [Lentinula raphanica]KAJ3977310.1 hypothetical protein EV361DRAFT_55952 [Lentinula raphanica]
MKRNLALVSYSSSDEESDSKQASKSVVHKKKKLPSLSSSLIVQTPKDDPALHQGRIRSTPHVDGQWASHVYVSIKVQKRSAMYNLVSDALKTAKGIEPALHDLNEIEQKPDNDLDLHVSLSRPIFLRSHQRNDLKREVRILAEKTSSFKVSFTTFSVLTNDEQTRTFLTLDIGSGHPELKLLSNGLLPFLATLRQKEYYAEPRFHASLAWALLITPCAKNTNMETDNISQEENLQPPVHNSPPSTQPPSTDAFRRIHRLPASLVATLNEQYASRLSSRSCSASDVHDICVKIGKDVFSWKLQG